MTRKLFLIGLVAIMAVGAVAIGRYPRLRPKSAALFNHPVDTKKALSIDGLKTDMLIPASSAPVAPAFVEGKWINSDPLTLERLRGRVVLVEFWTFACYNC